MEFPRPRDGGLLLSIAFFLSSPAIAAPVPVVRVMVERENREIRVEGFDLLARSAESGKLIAHEGQKALIRLTCLLGTEVRIAAGEPRRSVARNRWHAVHGPIRITSLGGFIRVGGSQYRDDLYVYSFNGDCVVVNHVDLEKYVAGLLNSEMSAKWSISALMAQAVAARTYAIHQMREASTTSYRGLRPPFDLAATVRDQVYEGANQERYKALRAVQETRGQVLTYHGKPIKAFYHSTCGGHTESPEKVWGVRLPYLKPVKCDYCQGSPRFNWVFGIPARDLVAKLAAARLVHGDFEGLRVTRRDSIGRADLVEVIGSLGTNRLHASRLRDLLGGLNLRSTDFTITRDPAKYVFIGHGSGHAVGMCQWGAKTMGERGFSYAEILKHYYPATVISKLY